MVAIGLSSQRVKINSLNYYAKKVIKSGIIYLMITLLSNRSSSPSCVYKSRTTYMQKFIIKLYVQFCEIRVRIEVTVGFM